MDNTLSGPVDVLAVRVGAEPAGIPGEWRGIVYVNGLPEFVTRHTYESKSAAMRAARSLEPQARDLARENAAALASVGSTK